LIGEILYEMSKEFSVKGAGGLTLGADPMASALMYSAWSHGVEINQFIVRKTLKQHGAVKWIEGNMKAGDKVIVLDDVVTTGGTVIQAIDKIKEEGVIVEGVIVLVDREEFDGMEKIRKAVPGKPVKAIISRSEIMEKYSEQTFA
jgi:orotate phosphoribosyltransferase